MCCAGTQFLAATINVGKLEREEHLRRAFEHFDKDGNGQISHSELNLVRVRHTQSFRHMGACAHSVPHDAGIAAVGQYTRRAACCLVYSVHPGTVL